MQATTAPAQAPAPANTGTTTAPPAVPGSTTAPPAPGSTQQQGAQPQMGCGAQGTNMLFPMALIFVVFYFMLIRPQQKKQKELQDWLKGLKKGDEVVTSGGVIGKISGMTDTTVTIEVQEKVRMKVLRSHVSGKAPGPGQPGPEPDKK